MQQEYCTSCRAHLRKNDIFCPKCGRKVKEEDSLNQALRVANQRTSSSPPKKVQKKNKKAKKVKKKKTIGRIAVVCLLALIFGVLGGYLITSDEAANQFRMAQSYGQGKKQYEAQEYEAAIKTMKQVKENSFFYKKAITYQDDCYLALARQSFSSEDYETTISILEKIKQNSKSASQAKELTAQANLALGMQKYEEKEYDEALLYFEFIDENQPSYAQAKELIDKIQSNYLAQGKRAYASGKDMEAKLWLDKIRQTSELYSEAQSILGKIEEKQQRDEQQKQQEEEDAKGIGNTLNKMKEDIKGKKLMRTGVLISNKTPLYYSPDESAARAGYYEDTSKYKVYDYQVTPTGVLWVKTLLEEGTSQYVWSIVE